jgi:hypothetical protein
MRLPTFAAVSLIVAIPSWSQAATVQQPEAAGIGLIGPQSPEFMGYVEQVLGAGGLQGVMEWQPLAVVLKNNSSQALIGYSLRWGINGGCGGYSTGSLSIYGADGNSLGPGAVAIALPVRVLTKTPSGATSLPTERRANVDRTATGENRRNLARFGYLCIRPIRGTGRQGKFRAVSSNVYSLARRRCSGSVRDTSRQVIRRHRHTA